MNPIIQPDSVDFEPRRIFDILIYRCSEKQYWAEQERDCAKYIRALNFDPASNARHVISIQQGWFEKYGGSWVINEAIGCISLEAVPGMIAGRFYLVDRRRITKRMTHKRIFYRDKLFMVTVYAQESRNKIFNRVRAELDRAVASLPSLKNRVVDFEPFDTLVDST